MQEVVKKFMKSEYYIMLKFNILNLIILYI